ncbi:MAG: sortase [Candidatus Nomurabacteria bacterium]|nr:MAG: sortase [Candidatus Nomurabacteria bacterium]
MQPENDNSEFKQAQRDAAANVVRDQLDALYDNQPKVMAAPKQDESGQTKEQAYQRANGWQQYHTEWQNYYRKYYEHYYVGKLHQAINEHEDAKRTPDEKQQAEIEELRAKIVEGAKKNVKKARKSRHFIPLVSAVVVVLVVAFLQYNEIIFANVQAYISPGNIDPQNIVVDPNASTHVPPAPKLIIPKINVDVPVVYNVPSDYNDLMSAMKKGVAHFSIPGANSVPGQLGNTVYSGHSSNDLFDPGDYKFIFAQLEKLKKGDTIFVNYNSTRYTYTVTKMQVVEPTDVQALLGHNDKPYLTLITCTPLGTALHRLLVTAEQISPDPSKAKAENTSGNSQSNTAMPGQAPTVLERLFGAR